MRASRVREINREYQRLLLLAFPQKRKRSFLESEKLLRNDYNRLRRIAFPEDYARYNAVASPRKKAWKTKNKAKCARDGLQYQRDNPHVFRNNKNRRRARVRENGEEDCSDKIRLLRLERFCHWCCRAMGQPRRNRPQPNDLTIDHVIPIARDGGHVRDNLVASCLKCNQSRGSKLISEWFTCRGLKNSNLTELIK